MKTQLVNNVMVIGDPMVDLWVTVKAKGLSAEAPVVVFDKLSDAAFGGGALNVWHNLQALGVGGDVVYAPGTPIPTKTRYITKDGQHLIRVDHDDKCWPLNGETLLKLLWAARPLDAIIISDYNKGTITSEVIDVIAAENVPTFIDTKRSPILFESISQRVFFPNRKEYTEFQDDYKAQPWTVLKLGELGAQVVAREKGVIAHAPATNPSPKSVCGAGDVVIASMVERLLHGQWRWDVALFDTMAVVGRTVNSLRTVCIGRN
jgi:bifunctional ADP-heptose synthase (sugar kinase/adenylyltransferase)